MYKFLTTILILLSESFLPNFANASDLLNITRGPDGVITLTSPSCQELIQQDQSLRSWSLALGETPGLISTPEYIPEDNLCSLNIDHSIPNIAYSLQGVKPALNGPNCWNTALRVSGLIQQVPRYSTPLEMTFWMNSPYCRELSESEPTLPGDIVEIRGDNPDQVPFFDEIHGMIYLSDKLVFSKNTSNRSSAYEIQRASLVYQSFRVDNPQCEKAAGHPHNCYKWANHYRCQNSQHDRLSFEQSNNHFAKISNEVQQIETIISAYVMNKKGNYESIQNSLAQQLNDLEKSILNAENDIDKTAFFVQALLHKMNSLKIQLDIIAKK